MENSQSHRWGSLLLVSACVWSRSLVPQLTESAMSHLNISPEVLKSRSVFLFTEKGWRDWTSGILYILNGVRSQYSLAKNILNLQYVPPILSTVPFNIVVYCHIWKSWLWLLMLNKDKIRSACKISETIKHIPTWQFAKKQV